jgi:flavoprotein, HI0933 family
LIYDVIIIGAGAAGLMASGALRFAGKSVLLLDKNQKAGRKIVITGKGRCNVTNNCDTQTLRSSIVRGEKFLYSSFNNFAPQDIIDFFEERGVPLKTERGNRVFPVSDRSLDIVDALYKYSGKHKQASVRSIEKQDDLYVVDGMKTRTVLIATGGVTYPATGSSGDGYAFAKAFGHTVIPPQAVLCGLSTAEDISSLEGLSLRNVKLSSSKWKSDIGEILFTADGVSGPLVLTASCYVEVGDTLSINLKPAMTAEEVDRRILREISAAPNKSTLSLLKTLLPAGLAEYFVKNFFSENPPCNSLTKEMRQGIVNKLLSLPLAVKGFDDGHAVITSGGVSLKEVSPKSLMSKLSDGLFFAGEVLDVHALTGGFNLTAAFATGYTSAMGIIDYLCS